MHREAFASIGRDIIGTGRTTLRERREDVAFAAFRAVRRWRWLALALLVGSLICGLTLARIISPEYDADAVLQLEFAGVNLSSEQSGGPQVDLGTIVQSEARIIESRMIAERVIARIEAEDGPDSLDLPRPGVAARLKDGLVGALNALIGENATSNPPARTARGEAIESILEAISVRHDPRSYLIWIVSSAENPATAAKFANTFAAEYVRYRDETREDVSRRAIYWLGLQIEKTAAEVRDAQKSLIRFRREAGIATSGTASTTRAEQRLQEALARSSDAKARLLAAEQSILLIKAGMTNATMPTGLDLNTLPLLRRIAENVEIQAEAYAKAATSFGEGHPSVANSRRLYEGAQDKIRSELSKLLVAKDEERAIYTDLVRELESNLNTAFGELLESRGREAELAQMEIYAASLRERLRDLRNSHATAQSRAVLLPSTARIVVAAQPPTYPSRPNTLGIVAGTLLAGAALAAFVPLLIEWRQRGLRGKADVEEIDAARYLGALPVKAEKESASRKAIYRCALASTAGSAGLLPSSGRVQVVQVTSALPREGKSAFLCDLAALLTAAGLRVLIVDLSPYSASPGVDGSCSIEDILTDETSMERFLEGFDRNRVLRAGRASGLNHEPGLGFPDALKNFLQRARGMADVVLIETPPVLLVGQPCAAALRPDLTILAARWGRTDRGAVEEAARRLAGYAGEVGVLLTQMKIDKNSSYFDFQAKTYRQYSNYFRKQA